MGFWVYEVQGLRASGSSGFSVSGLVSAPGSGKLGDQGLWGLRHQRGLQGKESSKPFGIQP